MKKQIVFIMVDSQSADMLGCYGNKDLKTPCLDALALEGVTYDKAYTCQPVCGPARSAIFTGLYPHSNGVWTNSTSPYANVKTLGQRVRDRGIQAAYIGKWHLDGGDYFGLGVCPDGWDKDYWYDMKNYLDTLTESERALSRRTSAMKEAVIEEGFTYAHRCSDKAMDYLEKHSDEDFLLVLSYDEPHDPSLCPEPYSSMYDSYTEEKKGGVYDTLEGKPSHQRVWAGERALTDKNALDTTDRLLYSCNSFVDYEIGRVLERVKEKAPDALIIYTSDHGEMRHSHSLIGKGPAPYDEITKIPLIIKAPGAGAGKRYPFPVSHISITPTILEYFGITDAQWLEGKSILSTAYSCDTRVSEHIFMEFGRYEVDHDGFGGFQPMRCVFDGRYKLCVNLLSDDELYDLVTDPAENNNLICCEETRDVRDSLHDALLTWMNETRDPFRGYYWHTRPWRKDAPAPTWRYTGYTRQRENEDYEPIVLTPEDFDTGRSRILGVAVEAKTRF